VFFWNRFQQDPHVSFVVKAVSALTAAFRLVQLDHCSQSVNAACLKEVDTDLHEDILQVGPFREFTISKVFGQILMTELLSIISKILTYFLRIKSTKQYLYILR
jgi:hypothetical protein